MATYTITAIDLTAKDNSIIKSLLGLFGSRLTDAWVITTAQQADIVICLPNKASMAVAQALLKPSSQLIYYGQPTDPEIEGVFLQKPMRTSEFIDCLNHFSAQQLPEQSTQQTSNAEIAEFNPSQYWLGALLDALKQKHNIRIDYPQLPPIYIESEKRCYYCAASLAELKPIYQAKITDIRFDIMTTDAWKTQVQQISLSAKNIDTLLWVATLVVSNGRLLQSHTLDHIIKLKRWPDFTQLPQQNEHMIIALQMSDGKRTLKEIADHERIALKKVINFYNGCAILGLVKTEMTAETPLAKVSVTDTKRQITAVGMIGFKAYEYQVVSKMMASSNEISTQYKMIQLDAEPANILLINADNIESMQELAVYKFKTGNVNATIILVSNDSSQYDEYCIARPLSTEKVVKALNHITNTSSQSVIHSNVTIESPRKTIVESKFSPIPEPKLSTSPAPDFTPALAEKLEAKADYTILVVDDSLAIRRQLKQELQQWANCDVMLADNGDQALQLVQENNYDIIFLDVVMPGIDGYDVCRNIKKDRYKKVIPVIMLTGKSSPFDKVKGKLSGCDAYLTKPVDRKTFIKTIERYLKSVFK